MSNLIIVTGSWGGSASVTFETSQTAFTAAKTLNTDPNDYWISAFATGNVIKYQHTSGGELCDTLAAIGTNFHRAPGMTWRVSMWGPSGSEGAPDIDSGWISPHMEPGLDDAYTMALYRHPSLHQVTNVNIEMEAPGHPDGRLEIGVVLICGAFEPRRNAMRGGLAWGDQDLAELRYNEFNQPHVVEYRQRRNAQFQLEAISQHEARQWFRLSRLYEMKTPLLVVLDERNDWVGHPHLFSAYGYLRFPGGGFTLQQGNPRRWGQAFEILGVNRE